MDVLVLENFILAKADSGRARRGHLVAQGVRARLTPTILLDRAERHLAGRLLAAADEPDQSRVKGRYSQSLFGIGWAIAQPLATMAVFTIVFARLAKMPSGGVPYPIFAYAALVHGSSSRTRSPPARSA